MSKFLRNKQLCWPSFERLPSEIEFDRRRPARNTSEQKGAPSLLIFVALDDKAAAFVPLDVKERELAVGRGDRSDVPDRTRPKSLEDLRHGQNGRSVSPVTNESRNTFLRSMLMLLVISGPHARMRVSYLLESRMDLLFTAVFRKVPEGYIGFVEELPGANTQGATLAEARANLQEAVALVLEANRTLAQEDAPGLDVIREPLKVRA